MTVVPCDSRADILADIKAITGEQARISQLLLAATESLQVLASRLALAPVAEQPEPAPRRPWWRFFLCGAAGESP